VKALVVWGLEGDKLPENLAKDSRIYTFRNFLELGEK